MDCILAVLSSTLLFLAAFTLKKLAKKMCGFLFFYNFAPEIIKEEKKRRNRKKRCHLTTCNIIHQQHVSRTGFVEVRFHL